MAYFQISLENPKISKKWHNTTKTCKIKKLERVSNNKKHNWLSKAEIRKNSELGCSSTNGSYKSRLIALFSIYNSLFKIESIFFSTSIPFLSSPQTCHYQVYFHKKFWAKWSKSIVRVVALFWYLKKKIDFRMIRLVFQQKIIVEN